MENNIIIALTVLAIAISILPELLDFLNQYFKDE